MHSALCVIFFFALIQVISAQTKTGDIKTNLQATTLDWVREKLSSLTMCRVVFCAMIACSDSVWEKDPNTCCGGRCVPAPVLSWRSCVNSFCPMADPTANGAATLCPAKTAKRDSEQVVAPICTQGTVCYAPEVTNAGTCYRQHICDYADGTSVQPRLCPLAHPVWQAPCIGACMARQTPCTTTANCVAGGPCDKEGNTCDPCGQCANALNTCTSAVSDPRQQVMCA